ncbi:glycerophosphodiester phosphodiesterase [Numidum massiliense]|uniref:glycerophosphodiester phosphodiesterase n=1 Tax=Numidum massiliense TaxID=1522315 RepID=UPI0006D52E39|nr:glycerophosphodiester phosphodiesterase [Numidum massiliense]
MFVIAHRGASGTAPENTMAAFDKALSLKVDAIETDIQLTKDGVPVICHDQRIDRTSDGSGFVCDYTLEELRQFDFSGKFSSDFRGEKIPTLEQFLQRVQHEDVILNIEIKNGPIYYDGIEDQLLTLLKTYDCLGKTVVNSFDFQCLDTVRQLDPTVKIGLILPINFAKLFDYIDLLGYTPYSLHPKSFYLTDELISGAKERNIKVYPWSVDGRIGERVNYEALGVDGVCTNYPERFINK